MEKYKVIPVTVNRENEKAPVILPVMEDTYVVDGDDVSGANALKDSNFCNSDTLHLKGDAGIGLLYRRVLLKFDVSALAGITEGRALIRLHSTGIQNSGTTNVSVYAIDSEAWSDKTVTFNTVPEVGELVATTLVGGGINYIDVSSYVKEQVNAGKTVVSFLLEGDRNEPCHVRFASSKNRFNQPQMAIFFGKAGFITNVAFDGNVEDVWSNAAEMVEEWWNDWEEIVARGDAGAEFVHEKPEEYSKMVPMGRNPKNPLVERPTRTMDSIEGYEPVKQGEIKLDEYGGYICDKKFEATGWFHVEEKYGRLWTVTPLGNPFFRKAIVSVSPGGEGRQHDAVMAKCGNMEGWAEKQTDYLKNDLGFNCMGAWSSIDTLSKVEKPLVLTQILGFVSVYARVNGMNNSVSGNTTFVGGVMPVFDPAFVGFADERASAAAPYADNPYVYGWMSDNELHSELKMLDSYLMADANNPWFAYSYATAWTFLRSVTGKEDADLCDVTDEYRRLFRAMIYNRYFRVIVTAIRKYDKNHMFMGSRFLPGCYRDEYVQRVAGKWCDVISMNYYGAWEPESRLMQDIQRWSGKPFIITEWYAKGMDACTPETRLTNESGAGFTVGTQRERGYFYHNYTLKLMESKGCAGFDWFKMWDNDPDNLKVDLSNRNSNKGIYTSDYEIYTDLVDEMRLVNNNCYKLIDFFDADSSRSN